MQMLTVFSLILRCLYIIRIVMMRDISATESYKYLKARRLKEYDDKKTQLSEIQTLTRVTRMDCCAACSREKYCHSFHFYPDGPTCVILRERLGNISVTSTRAPGYQLYQTDKPLPRLASSGCELDVDCKTLLNSRCLQGSCRCDVGYRLHGNTCRNTKVPCEKSPGYTLDDDRNMCYRIERRQKKTWRGAERTCTMEHGHLIKPDTATKLATLRRILRTTHMNKLEGGFWIGARFSIFALGWQWFDRTYVTSPLWGPEEPFGDGSCVQLPKFSDFKWNDMDCLSTQYNVCEIYL